MARSKRVPSIYKKITQIFIVLSVILILVIIFFESGKTKIEIDIADQTRDINFAAPVSEVETENTLIGKILQIEIEKTKEAETPASLITETKAGGLVTIINNYSSDQALVETTRLLTPENLLFRITESVNVPAGGQVQVQAKADEEGDQYLIDPTQFTIPGLWEGLQDKIYAESNLKMSYTTHGKYQVTEEVYNQTKDELIEEIKLEAFDKLSQDLAENETINFDALAIEIVEENSNVEINEEVEEFSITLKIKINTLVFNESDLREMIISQLADTIEPGDRIEYDDPEMVLNIELYPEDEDNIAVITGQYQVKILNANIDFKNILGLSKNQAEDWLKNQPNIENANVSFWPFWITKIPDDENKIEVIVK